MAWGGGAGGVSVQGERARGESGVYRDRRAVLQLPLVSLVSMGGGTKPSGHGELEGGLGCERARQACKVSVQGEKRSLWGWGGVLCSFHWLLLCTNPRGNGGLGGGVGFWGECAR